MLIRTLRKAEQRDGLTILGDINAALRHWAQQRERKVQQSASYVNEAHAMTLPWAYSAINVLSDTVAHVPLELRQRTSKGGSVGAIDHPMYDIVHNSPSSNLTSFTWRKTAEGHRNGWGNSQTWIRRRPGTNYVWLEALPPATTRSKLLETGDIVHETTTFLNQNERLLDLDVLHFKGMGYDGVRGYSPPQMLRLAFSAGLSMQQFNDRFFSNGAHLKGVIQSEMGGNNYERMAQWFKDNYGSLEEAYGTPVLPKGWEYKSITINPDDAQFLEIMAFNRSVVAGIYRVPAHLINDQEHNTFTNVIEMDLGFVKHTMVPIFVNYEQELNRKLLTRRERQQGYFFKFNVKGLLRGAQTDRYDSYHAAINDGWMSRNEARELEDMETMEGLDEFMVPHNMKSASQLTAPMVNSLASRMATLERNAIAKCGEDPEAVANFLTSHKDWIQRNLDPIAVQVEMMTGQPAASLTRRFTERHIDRIRGSMRTTIAEAIPTITEAGITRTFYEVLDEDGTTIHSE